MPRREQQKAQKEERKDKLWTVFRISFVLLNKIKMPQIFDFTAYISCSLWSVESKQLVNKDMINKIEPVSC